MIQGIHHVAINCHDQAEFDKVVGFYRDILGLPICLAWDGAAMLDTGAGRMEILLGNAPEGEDGVLRHIAFDVTDPDELTERVRAAGYPITIEPKDVVLSTCNARIAFCKGPVNEVIEFFQVK